MNTSSTAFGGLVTTRIAIARIATVAIKIRTTIATRTQPPTPPDTSQVISSLGPTWAHCANVRLVLQFPRRGAPGTREVRVAKAPLCEEVTFSYLMDSRDKHVVA